MKANAPEKIYLFENPITETPDDRWLSKRSDENDVEYIRTDALIEKAKDFFEEYLTEEECKFGTSEWIEVKSYSDSIDSFISSFENYIKKQ